jgi:hypothetical protein
MALGAGGKGRQQVWRWPIRCGMATRLDIRTDGPISHL